MNVSFPLNEVIRHHVDYLRRGLDQVQDLWLRQDLGLCPWVHLDLYQEELCGCPVLALLQESSRYVEPCALESMRQSHLGLAYFL